MKSAVCVWINPFTPEDQYPLSKKQKSNSISPTLQSYSKGQMTSSIDFFKMRSTVLMLALSIGILSINI